MLNLKRLGLATAVLAALFSTTQHAHAVALCEWRDGVGPLEFSTSLPAFWVPRDAAVGTVIGRIPRRPLTDTSGTKLFCDNDGSITLVANMTTPLPIAPGSFPPLDGAKDLTGKVLQTSIPGVGLYIELGSPVHGAANNYFSADDGRPAVPFRAVNQQAMTPNALLADFLDVTLAALIKTGDIPPGPHNFDQLVVQGTVADAMNVMNAYRLNVSGQVQQAQCSLKSDAVSADPVQLGTHDVGDFKGVGTTTAPTDFHITLSDCEDDPSGSVARAYMRLDGVEGSAPIDRDRGLFSLTADSTASGLGIQILRSDNRPLKLEDDVEMVTLVPGTTRIDLRAQYYQTDAHVTAGVAKGALNFTINYR